MRSCTFSACVHGSTNGVPISFMVLPMVPLVFSNGTIGFNGITNGTIGRTLINIGIPLAEP